MIWIVKIGPLPVQILGYWAKIDASFLNLCTIVYCCILLCFNMHPHGKDSSDLMSSGQPWFCKRFYCLTVFRCRRFFFLFPSFGLRSHPEQYALNTFFSKKLTFLLFKSCLALKKVFYEKIQSGSKKLCIIQGQIYLKKWNEKNYFPKNFICTDNEFSEAKKNLNLKHEKTGFKVETLILIFTKF